MKKNKKKKSVSRIILNKRMKQTASVRRGNEQDKTLRVPKFPMFSRASFENWWFLCDQSCTGVQAVESLLFFVLFWYDRENGLHFCVLHDEEDYNIN